MTLHYKLDDSNALLPCLFVPQPTCCRAVLLLLLFPCFGAKPLLLLPTLLRCRLRADAASPLPTRSSLLYKDTCSKAQLWRSSMGEILGRALPRHRLIRARLQRRAWRGPDYPRRKSNKAGRGRATATSAGATPAAGAPSPPQVFPPRYVLGQGELSRAGAVWTFYSGPILPGANHQVCVNGMAKDQCQRKQGQILEVQAKVGQILKFPVHGLGVTSLSHGHSIQH